MNAVQVKWGRGEVAAVLALVRTTKTTAGGRKQALEALLIAERQLATNENPKARVPLYFGVRPLGLLGTVLAKAARDDCRTALASLKAAALESKRAVGKATLDKDKVNLHNVRSETRQQHARHVSGRPRGAR